MHWKLQRLQWSTEWTQFFSPTMPNCTSQSVLQKLNELGYEVLPYLLYSPDQSPTNYYFFKHPDNFLQGKCFHNQQEAHNTFQESVKSRSMDFYATGINKHFSLAKNVLIVMVPILINKDMFDPSYNDLTEKAMAPHSSTLAWKSPWMEEPGRLRSMGTIRVGHDFTFTFTFIHWRRKWQPTPVFLPGESQGWGSLVGCRLWGRTESDTTEAT